MTMGKALAFGLLVVSFATPSLAPDGASCDGKTKGLLRRSNIVARSLVPVGKETDRHWEQGEDPSMLDPKIQIYGRTGKLVVADKHEREEWRKYGS